MSLGEKLLELRKKNGLSQEDLAFELKLSQSTISNYEKGFTFPDIVTLEKYSEYFNIPIIDLIDKEAKIAYNYQNTGGENAFQIVKNTNNEEMIEQYKETINALKDEINILKEHNSFSKDLLDRKQ